MDSATAYQLPPAQPDNYAGLRGPLHRVSRGLASYMATKSVRAANTRPLLTLTFDDIPDSAFINGTAVLESHGARGTFYIAGSMCGTVEPERTLIAASDCIELHRRGHEIGCHTFSHPKLPLLNARQLADDLDRNAAFFASLIPDLKLENFCFPYGLTSLPRKHQVQARFDSCRSSKAGINHGRIDLGFLKSVPLDHTSDLPTITRYIDETVRLNGWLVLFTHDVSDQPTWIGCTPKLLDAIVTYAMRQGCEVATVKEALRRIGATAQVSA